LRVIQSSEIQAVGQDKIINVNVRIIAATNRNLQDEVEKGNFRADLFHRLNVYPIDVPPLRERHGDVALLVGFFIEKIKRKLGIKQLKTSNEVIQYLSHYDWPGNVRELEHLLSRAALKAFAKQKHNAIIKILITDCDVLVNDLINEPKQDIKQESISPGLLNTNEEAEKVINHEMKPKGSINLRQAVDVFQKKLISHILTEEQGNWSLAAKRLNTDRANLNRLAKRLGIQVNKVVV
jgi:anaerobic nitric oxide reductase transcription regulator